MKFLSVLLTGMTVLSVFADAALLQNGDFNGKDHLADITVNQDRGKIRVSKVTEDLSWNKCVKMEIAGFREKDGKKELSCGLIFGKTAKTAGCPSSRIPAINSASISKACAAWVSGSLSLMLRLGISGKGKRFGPCRKVPRLPRMPGPG